MSTARLSALGISGGEAFWEAVKSNLSRLSDAKDLWTLVAGPVTPMFENRELTNTAAELLPPEPFDDSTWSSWTGAVSSATGAVASRPTRPIGCCSRDA